MSRKRIADIILKKILGETSDKSLRQIARGQGYKSIDEWVEGGAEGLTKGLKKEAEIERRTAATETRERRRAHGKKTDDPEFKEKFEETYVAPQKELRALEEAERKERTGFNPNIFINTKLKSDLFKAREAASALENLRRTGPARRNLTQFTENLTNERIIKQAIREGHRSPVKWEEAGLPPWPEEFRSLSAIAKIRLGFGETKEGMGKVLTPKQQRTYEQELRRLQKLKEAPKDPRQFNIEEARARARREIQRAGGSPSYTKGSSTAPAIGTQRADELEVARRQQAESGFEFDPQDVKKTELDYVEKTGDDLGLDFEPSPEVVLADPDFKQARSAWSRAATPPRIQRGSGVDIRGNPVGEELIWSPGLERTYRDRLKQLGVKEKDLTPEEIRGVQEEVAAFSAKEALYPEVDYITPQSLSGSTDVTDKLGFTLADINRRMRSLDPAEDAEELLELRASKESLERELQKRFGGKQYVKGGEPTAGWLGTDVPFKGERVAVPTMGSPASSMQQILRGDAFTKSDPDIRDIAEIQQRYPSDRAQQIIENMRTNPDIGVPADRSGEEAAFRAGRGRRAATDLEKGLKDPAENISYGAPSTREIAGEVGKLPSYDPKVISSLRRKATNLRKKREAFRDEVATIVTDIGTSLPQLGRQDRARSAARIADFEEARELAWEEVRKNPKYKKYLKDRLKLIEEINDKTPQLMQFDSFEKPRRKLVDSFKKGRKIVNRKKGGIIKKPRGWGIARYAGR